LEIPKFDDQLQSTALAAATRTGNGVMTPQAFIAKWQKVNLSERSACQQHFLDLCELLSQCALASYGIGGLVWELLSTGARSGTVRNSVSVGGAEGDSPIFVASCHKMGTVPSKPVDQAADSSTEDLRNSKECST
jgi:hypothetical protein